MKRKTYPIDLSDEQWKLLYLMLPPPERFGRKRQVDLREIFNALCYLARSGCQWRMLSKEFPKWQTVYYSSPGGAMPNALLSSMTLCGKRFDFAQVAQLLRVRQSLIRNRSKPMNKPTGAAMMQAKRSKGESVISEAWLYLSMSILMLKCFKN